MDLYLGIASLILAFIAARLLRVVWRMVRKPKPKTKGGINFAGRFIAWPDACRHFLFCGASGSGKTFSSNYLLKEFMRAGCAMMCTCVKMDDPERLIKLAKEVGQEHRLVVVEPDGPHRFNLLDAAMEGHMNPDIAATRLMEIARVGMPTPSGGDASDQFFSMHQRRCVSSCITLALAVKGKATLIDVFQILNSTPATRQEVLKDPQWGVNLDKDENGNPIRRGVCAEMVVQAMRRKLDSDTRVDMAIDYLTEELVNAGDRARGGILSGTLNFVGPLVAPPWRDFFCSDSTLSCQDIEKRGLIVILAMPLHTWGVPGRMGQFAFTQHLSHYALRRPFRVGNKPTVLVRDEAAFVLNPDFDAKVCITARSQGLCLVDLFQDLPSGLDALGGQRAEPQLMSFLANHSIKTCFQTTDIDKTGAWLSKVIGDKEKVKVNSGTGRGGDSLLEQALCVNGGHGWTTAWEPIVRPADLANLRIGEAIIHMNGQAFRHKF